MRKDILFIDDDEDELIIFIEALSQLAVSFKCTWAKSGELALEELLHLEPAVMFLDLNMPGMDGFQTLVAIRQLPAAANIPVIFNSTGLTAENASMALRLGAAACVKKNSTVKELADTLKELLPIYTGCVLPVA